MEKSTLKGVLFMKAKQETTIKRATLLKTTLEKNLSQSCQYEISLVIKNSKEPEETAEQITALLNEDKTEEEILQTIKTM